MELEANKVIEKLQGIIAKQAGEIAVLQAMVEQLEKPTDS